MITIEYITIQDAKDLQAMVPALKRSGKPSSLMVSRSRGSHHAFPELLMQLLVMFSQCLVVSLANLLERLVARVLVSIYDGPPF